MTFAEHAGDITKVYAQVYPSKEVRDIMARHMPLGSRPGSRLDAVFAESAT